VVIGVSAYDHLASGIKPVKETYGLGQLKVSALTAYRFFEWLTSNYKFDSCEIAKVWVLLSPTAAEESFEPSIKQGDFLPATFTNCEQSIGSWHAAMATLPQSLANKSRAIFFFSGHGLEIHQEQQILLPADYLCPPAHNVNKALSTDNLKKGLASLAVPCQFFFIDACRNDNQALRAKRLTGTPVLNEDASSITNAFRVAPLLYATASGQRAFQHPEPAKGLSLFGRALIDGLNGEPDIALECVRNSCSVKLYPLQGYVKARVVDLLTAEAAKVYQPVVLSGIVDNEPVTLLPHRHRLSPKAMPRRGPDKLKDVQTERVIDALKSRFPISHQIKSKLESETTLSDFNVGHAVFGSEHVTDIWHNARGFALDQGTWLPPGSIVLHNVQRDSTGYRYRVAISIAASGSMGYWLQLKDHHRSYGIVLPTDPDTEPRFIIEFEPLTHVVAFLSTENQGYLKSAAELWQIDLTSHLGNAVEAAKKLALSENLLARKIGSPLAATAAILVLLRANRLESYHNCMKKLINNFPNRPDGAALWIEHIIRESHGDRRKLKKALAYTTKMFETGLPHTSEALSYAARNVELLLKLRIKTTPQNGDKLFALHKQITDALTYFQPGGQFAVFTGFKADAVPNFIMAWQQGRQTPSSPIPVAKNRDSSHSH
jgi:hypothetical protein